MQLCLTFMALCWYGMAPFMQELYSFRARLFLAETVLGDKDLLSFAPGEAGKLEAMRQMSLKLSEPERVRLEEDAAHYQEKLNAPFGAKLGRSLAIFIRELPPLLTAQLILGLLISFAFLYRIEGAQQTVWLLPLLSLLLVIDNSGRLKLPPMPEEQLYPTARALEALGSGTSARERFESGWRLWLLQNWTDKAPPHENALYRAEFALSHALIKLHRSHPTYDKAALYDKARPNALLLLAFGWNLFFALTLSRKDPYERAASLDCPHHSL